MTDPEGHIEYKHVKFSYPSRKDIQIFKDLELDIAPGKMVAVVGPSGSGDNIIFAIFFNQIYCFVHARKEHVSCFAAQTV